MPDTARAGEMDFPAAREQIEKELEGFFAQTGQTLEIPAMLHERGETIFRFHPPGIDKKLVFEALDAIKKHVENLRIHYAETLKEWLRRFDEHVDEIARMYDESFVRAWRLYLGGCSAAFLASTIQLFQVVIAHPDDNRIPMTREHVYGRDGPDWDL